MAFDAQAVRKQFNIGVPIAKSAFDANAVRAKLPTAKAPKKLDVNSVEGLGQKAIDLGLEDEVNRILDPTPKLSVLQRIGKGLSVLNPAEAILTGTEQGAVSGAKKYVSGVFKGVASAVTGTDYEGERRTFSDVAEKLGIENSIAKFGIGLVGDILLDPSTYFGASIARGLGKVAGVAGGTALKTVGKVAPDVEAGLRLAGKGAKEAAGKAFVYGYGTSKGLRETALELETKLSGAKAGIVKSNLARLGTDTLSPSQQDELVAKLMSGKRAEFEAGRGIEGAKDAAREAAQSGDPLVQKTIEQQSKRSQKFAKQAGIQDPYEIYFPGLKADKVQKFLEGTRTLRVGSEGYKKQFKNLLTDDELIKNPAEAFATREFAIAKDSILRSELNGIVKDHGLPLTAFKSEDDALKAGYKLVKEKGMFGKSVGYLKETDKKFLDNLISPEFTTIDAIAKATGFDALTSLFKRSVTGLFVPFHVRNFVSGHIQNFEAVGAAALNPLNISAGQKLALKLARGETKFASEVVEMGGKSVDLGKAFKRFSERFGGSSAYISDIADATKGAGNLPGKILGKESLKTTLKTAGLGQQSIPFRGARAIGNYIETQQKATAFIAALGQGKSIDDALRLAEKAGFDYRALTPFESKILRRIVPFYSFTRKNVELQLKTLGENPQRINQIAATINNLGDELTDDEKQYLPDYIKNSFGIKMDDTPEGLKQYISSFGTPIEHFTNLLSGNPILKSISQMNPILKAPVEVGIGKDSFRERDLKEVYDAREYKAAPQFVKDLLEITEVQKPVLKENAAGKLVKVGERTQYIADPIKLLIARSLFTSRGFSYFDQAFGGDLQGFAKALRLTTGLKPQQVDIEAQKYFKERDQKRALEDILTKRGEVSQFTRNYIPKK
jgi:hypothetical protein